MGGWDRGGWERVGWEEGRRGEERMGQQRMGEGVPLLGVSLMLSGQMILRMQYSERIPYGPTSRRLMISVVMMSVSVVSAEHCGYWSSI